VSTLHTNQEYPAVLKPFNFHLLFFVKNFKLLRFQDEDLARQLVELGYRGSGEVQIQKRFEKQ